MWLGFMIPRASTKLKMIDNGVCLVDEKSVLFAVSEERLSRKKHDHRIERSIQAFLEFSQHSNKQLRSAGISSCSDSPWQAKTLRGSAGKLKVTSVPSHHYSHALSAFMLSGFSESLVLVMDAGGNTYSADDTRRWWETPREQTSLWYGKNSRLYLLERREFLPYEVGYGECYRAFTHFLGWGSHTNSGNTMALAALGNHRSISENGIWDITSLPMNTIRNEPDRPIEMVVKLLKRIGCKIPPRNPFEKIEQAHKDLAAWLQFSLVANVKEYLRKSFSLYANNNVCLSGG